MKRTTILMPRELKEQLKALAKEQSVSMAEMIRQIVAEKAARYPD
ncbi:MAG TPA: CopG family transcriptional regulator [Dehalococcoidia bacterium]|nr:CopG family transcriptional regulator [Dehalococcoidia bacterium]